MSIAAAKFGHSPVKQEPIKKKAMLTTRILDLHRKKDQPDFIVKYVDFESKSKTNLLK